MHKRSPQAEECLEMLVRYARQRRQPKIKDLAHDLGITPASTSQMLKKLSAKGYVKYERYGEPRLTEKGEKVGHSVLRKHHLIEKFLMLIGVKKKNIHKEACLLEHALSDDVERSLERAVKALEEPRTSMEGAVRLTDLREGESGIIFLLDCGKGACRRLMDMGLTPGTKIILQRPSTKMGPVEISVRSSTLAIGRGIAEKIFVKVKR